jgi:MFS transporter, DHA1 family, tetracycline resistance protein
LKASGNRSAIFPILLINFIGTLGFSIVLPFLVFMVSKFQGNALVYGLLSAVYPLFQLIGAPLLGKWSDVHGRKKILLLSSAGTAIAWVIFLLAFYVPVSVIFEMNSGLFAGVIITIPVLVLFAARALDGITGGNISVANAYLADVTTEKDRNKNFGKMSISSNLGFIAGPALAGVLGATTHGEVLPVIAALVISTAATLLVMFYLPDKPPKPYEEDPDKVNIVKIMGQENKECFKVEGGNDITLKKVLKMGYIPFLLVLNFLIFLGFNFFYTSFPVHVVQSLNWSLGRMGMYFALLSLIMVIVQGPVLSYASKKFSDSTLIITGNVILATNFLLLFTNDIVLYYIAAVLFAVGNGLMWPSFMSLLSKAAGKKFQGSVQGFAGSMGSLASIAGLIIGGVLYETLGAATFLISAGIIYLVFFMSFRLIGIEKACKFKLTSQL